MTYNKPEIVSSGKAINAIEQIDKQETPLFDSGSGDFDLSVNAYQADE